MANTTQPNLSQSTSLLDNLAYGAREFLKTAATVEDFNARQLFIELTHMPSPQIMRQYAANELIHHWSSPVPEPGNDTVVFLQS